MNKHGIHLVNRTLLWGIKGRKRLVELSMTNNTNQSLDGALKRLHYIEYYSKYGLDATLDAFKLKRSTFFRWRKRYLESDKDLNSLTFKSKAPRRKRIMLLDFRLEKEIRRIRQEHYRLGKSKLKPLLDEFCIQNNIECLSESKIGRILKKHLLVRRTKTHIKYKKYKLKLTKAPKESSLGYVEIDTTEIFSNGIKRYILNAIDINSRFQFSYVYTKLNSTISTDFLSKLLKVYPCVKKVQTDNGLEFMGNFKKYLKTKSIKQYFIYPRCPKINGKIERSNRSLKEEFLYPNLSILLKDISSLNTKLMEYLIWYNTKRFHSSIKSTPLNYILSISNQSHMYWTYTKSFYYSSFM